MWNHYAEEKEREYRVWAAEREAGARVHVEARGLPRDRVMARSLGRALVRAGETLQRWADPPGGVWPRSVEKRT
jgi:hypothetical protein